jgi:hypothetical protein
MDVSSIASVATNLSNAGTSQAISTAVLKKSIDLSAEGALALIQAIPDSHATQNLPANLGQNINTTA